MVIRNHYSHKLSALDVEMVKTVPPGGNWKDIPVTIPSQRLRQIRESYARGGGSRSTYYGRLHPDRPAYTISTCFNRPGNGCFIHYNVGDSQHRLISQREAARLQSFPDSVEFFGSKASINKQIGNAVPPLLAFQIARSLGEPGCFVDLFCGTGGLSLGFVWAKWRPLLGVDLEASFLQTYSSTVDPNVVCGDIRRASVFAEIVERSRRLTSHTSDRFFVLGGPPCQGFSTAGNRRSMSDGRNLLYIEYCRSLELLRPDGFLFENVLGLTNMNGGRVFATILRMLEELGYSVSVWRLKAEDFGIPQRRHRIFVVGARGSATPPAAPSAITTYSTQMTGDSLLPPVPTVKEALDDLPPIGAGEDGSALDYQSAPSSRYVQFVRGIISPTDYIEQIRRDHTDDTRH